MAELALSLDGEGVDDWKLGEWRALDAVCAQPARALRPGTIVQRQPAELWFHPRREGPGRLHHLPNVRALRHGLLVHRLDRGLVFALHCAQIRSSQLHLLHPARAFLGQTISVPIVVNIDPGDIRVTNGRLAEEMRSQHPLPEHRSIAVVI